MATKGAVSLRNLKDQINSVKATQLERRIGFTILDSYRDVSKVEFMNAIKEASEEERATVHNIAMPTLQYFCDHAPGLREKLIELYNSKMNSVAGFENVPDNVKVSQGALLDGLCYVYDMHTGSVTIATMNLDILYDLNVETNMQKQIMTKNLEGLCKAYRIDIEYINGDQEFMFKAVNARNYDIDDPKMDTDPSKNFVLVPYTAGVQLMKICENLLDRGAILRIRQVNDSAVKLRFLTNNKDALAAYCDSKEAAEAVKPNYFPLKAFFYAPSMGSSSLTAMVSRVNLFNVDSICIASNKMIKNSDLRKVTNPARDLFGERLFVSAMMDMKEKSPEDFEAIIGNLSRHGKIIKDVESIDEVELSHYMHSVTPAAMEKAYRLVGIEEQLDRMLQYFGNVRPMTAEELEDLEGTLAKNVCKFTIRKKDCSLGSVLCTNNKHMLVVVYGKEMARYESFSSRFYRFASFLKDLYGGIMKNEDTSIGSENWKYVKEELEDVYFPFSNEIYSAIISAAEDSNEDLFINRVKVIIADAVGVDLKRSEAASASAKNNKENGIYKCVSLTARLDENGKAVDFYKNLDKSKILSAWVLE